MNASNPGSRVAGFRFGEKRFGRGHAAFGWMTGRCRPIVCVCRRLVGGSCVLAVRQMKGRPTGTHSICCQACRHQRGRRIRESSGRTLRVLPSIVSTAPPGNRLP